MTMTDEMMWQGVEAGYRRLAENRAEDASYRAETAEWTSADLGELAATTADEYPQYNCAGTPRATSAKSATRRR